MSWKKTIRISILGLMVLLLMLSFLPSRHVSANMPANVQDLVQYYTAYTTGWARSIDPMSVPIGSGIVSQTANPDGSVNVNINNTPGYADSGFYFPIGRLGDLRSIVINATLSSSPYWLNLYFDKNNDGRFFGWTGDTYTGLSGDDYASCTGSVAGVLTVTQATSCYVMGAVNKYTITQLQSGAVAGIDANTQIGIWAGISSNGGDILSATFQSIAINKTAPVVWVDDSYNASNCGGHTWLVDCFATIQTGLNAVLSWGRVNVAPGTYTENIVISKPVTLVATSGPSVTFIDSSITGNPYIVFISGRDVILDGFNISSPGYAGGSDASGVVVEPYPYGPNAHVRVTNNVIHDVGTPTRTSVSFGNVGINIGGADGVEVDHNTVYNILHNCPTAWANGMSIWGLDLSNKADHILVRENIFYNISSPFPTDAAISTQTDVGSVTLLDNSIVSTVTHPTELGLEVQGANTVEAISNWWGKADGPSGLGPGSGSAITSSTTFDPWCSIDCSAPETGVGSAGGTAIRSPWSLIIPAGTIPNGSLVYIVNLDTSRPAITAPLHELKRMAGISIQGPAGPLTSFTNPLQVCYHYSSSDLSAGFVPSSGVIATSDSNGTNWTMLQTSLNSDAHQICANASHLSYFEVFYSPSTGGDGDTGDGEFFIPVTGFAPGRFTLLSTVSESYKGLGDLNLVVPLLGIDIPIVGVPQTNDKTWDVSWLGQDAGWLAGSAFPTWNGNSVLTAHVYDAFGKPGPFVNLNKLKWGDRIIINAWGFQYVYEVREVLQVTPEDASAMMKHQTHPWLTLVTCRGYDESLDTYLYRVLIRAVLVKVK
jgi:LPXTG-site transpeptidase (sortase) family protein